MLYKIPVLFLFVLLAHDCLLSQSIIKEPQPSDKPNVYQLDQIKRKYGMFIHFGVNTFYDQEWTDGSKPAASFKPLTVDADEWVHTAKEAGMKYVILVSKHVDGFCLWDSKYTDYDVASSGNKTNVVEKVAEACRKYGIGMGIYYSLWDRHQNVNVNDTSLDKDYNVYIVNQIRELIGITNRYTPLSLIHI